MAVKKLLILGGGMAALSAAEAAREANPTVEIVMVAREPEYPYLRFRLSSFIGKTVDTAQLGIKKPHWYEEKKIKLLRGTAALAINNAKKEVSLNNGETIYYDRLIIATGSRAIKPSIVGSELPQVHTLRTLEDLRKINIGIQRKEEARCSVVIVGGGLLGLEAAWDLLQKGFSVTVLERGSYLLRRQLDEEGAKFLEERACQEGLNLIKSANVAEIHSKNEQLEIHLQDGRVLEGFMTLFSVGVQPQLNLLRQGQLSMERGLVVNANMNTSDPAIFAAGDAAEYEGKIPGLWAVAMEQGKVAGYNAVTDPAQWRSYAGFTPASMLNVLGTKVFSLGQIDSKDIEVTTLQEIDEKKGQYKKVFLRQSRIIGAILLGDLTIANRLREAIATKRDFSKQELSDFMNLRQSLGL
ncbi:NAD(P)/FAD-dependent oxidoreductase [Heliorestis convoluta]|uniref:NAD(P)/FAD dependent oxidoreductase n=1 Tax=Heliorestis convoluta TaxID=356322 RepID=A0A5Q2N5W4_9FIRM|nr:FAD-dependent oxidoreductase [Heliorestis convoluta]QGG49333.1 NAD(P)/FAD dependent oxidoreductase [Heliorestis convoluta]